MENTGKNCGENRSLLVPFPTMPRQNPKTESKERESAEESTWDRSKKTNGMEVVGRVQVPEIWGQERSLKDWIDCKTFDSMLVNKAVGSARAALAEEGRRVNPTKL